MADLLVVFEWLALISGVACVWLLVRENILTFPIGLIFSALTLVVLYYQRLYANLGETAYYLIMNAYGWYHWSRGLRVANQRVAELPVQPFTLRLGLVCVLLWALGSAGLGWSLSNTDADLPYWDSASTVGAFLAMWMSARKYLASWVLWFVVDVVYVGLYLYKGLEPYALLYLIYLGMAVWGWLTWRKQLQPAPSA